MLNQYFFVTSFLTYLCLVLTSEMKCELSHIWPTLVIWCNKTYWHIDNINFKSYSTDHFTYSPCWHPVFVFVGVGDGTTNSSPSSAKSSHRSGTSPMNTCVHIPSLLLNHEIKILAYIDMFYWQLYNQSFTLLVLRKT